MNEFQQQLELNWGEKISPRLSASLPIDEDFPVEDADKLAQLESYNKHLYRPNTYLHKWWARRSGTTFRFILKSLVNDSNKSGYYLAGGLEGKTIMDPMMGGGTILHEAIRLGASVVGIDIDPIPVLQAEATLTPKDLDTVNDIFLSLRRHLTKDLENIFLTRCDKCDVKAELQFCLYAQRRTCSCGESLFVDSYVIREEKDGNINLCPSCGSLYKGQHHKCKSINSYKCRIFERNISSCPVCGENFKEMLDVPYYLRYRPIAMLINCARHGQCFKNVDSEDLSRINQANQMAENLNIGSKENFSIIEGPKSRDLISRNIASYLELFSGRQRLYIKSGIDFLHNLPRENRLWLGLLLSTSLEFNSMLCGYKGASIKRPGAVRHVFSHHAYSFPYTALENNPLASGNSSGSINRIFNDRVKRAIRWAKQPEEVRVKSSGKTKKIKILGETDAGKKVDNWAELRKSIKTFMLFQHDASTVSLPRESIDFVVTDPPYYDNVQYSDLSAFFRVWLRVIFPDDVDWQYDPVKSAVSEGNGVGTEKYGEVLAEIWNKCRESLKKESGRLIFTFHHWKPEAWSELTHSLSKAGFELVNRYVIHSENPISVHIRDLKSIKHDAILVLRAVHGTTLKPWPSVDRIRKNSSEAFCHDCGSALGWLLSVRADRDQIYKYWSDRLS